VKNPIEKLSLPACTTANPHDSMHSTIWCDRLLLASRLIL